VLCCAVWDVVVGMVGGFGLEDFLFFFFFFSFLFFLFFLFFLSFFFEGPRWARLGWARLGESMGRERTNDRWL
jgi:hypothetical protein